MFSALNQGSLIHILDKTNGIKYKVGEVIGITQANQFGSAFNNSSFINPNALIVIKARVDGEVRDFPEIPSGQSVMSYNGNKLIISETVQGIQSEVENHHKHNTQILSNIDVYKKEIEDCENIMKELNPKFALDKERDEKINTLATKVTGIEDKLDAILNKITNKD